MVTKSVNSEIVKRKVYFVMDPIESINPQKDTTLAFMFEAFTREFEVWVTEPAFLSLNKTESQEHHVTASAREVFFNGTILEFTVGKPQLMLLNEAVYIFMRQDPPVTIEYINTTFLLDFLEETGVLVVNNPSKVRSSNEKLTATWFSDCAPETLISCSKRLFHDFLEKHQDIILKPLDGMGGQGVFRVKLNDQNLDSIVETLTKNGRLHIMAQTYIPEIVQGDKRILMINGEPIPFALARVPQTGALRGNLAAGGHGVGMPLSERDLEICAKVGPWLKENSLYFVGLDVIGDFLTEINVTSPTCVRELDKIYNLNISGQLFDVLQEIQQRPHMTA